MKFYTANDDYINYLKRLDKKVLDNKKRPYIGVVLEFCEHKYLAPLTSYSADKKLKQDSLKVSNVTIFKIHEKGDLLNKLGMLHLNNMIPVLESEITPLDFSIQEVHYKNLLLKQYEFIKSEQETIKKKAAKLHNLVTVKKNQHFCHLSCDFASLESNYKDFKKYR